MEINKRTAVLVTDPQNDFLSEQGVTWKLVGDSVKENKTVENIERLFKTAKANGFEVFILTTDEAVKAMGG
jgi:nicotinamidase-related amidase